MVLIQELFTWKGQGKGPGTWNSKCYLQVFYNDGRVIAIASDLGPETGTSITNSAAALATMAFNYVELIRGRNLFSFFGNNPTEDRILSPSDFVWIERYPGGVYKDRPMDTFDLVSFEWNGKSFINPAWKPLQIETVERLIGEPIP
jgi:hypothetical protein